MSAATQLTVAANNGHAPARVSLLATMASKYSMEPAAFAATLRATVMPASTSNEQMAAFLVVAHEYGLNPITREIHAFPSKGGITPVVGIDGWINLAQRRPEFDGMEHEFHEGEHGEPISCTCTIWRKDRGRPVRVTEYMSECRRPTDPWKAYPRRLLRHKATIQAIRYAFGFAGIKDEDDAEVIYAGPVETVRAAPVADLNARLAAVAAPALAAPAPVETDEGTAPDWPQADPASGEMLDARGLPWDERIHASSKSCNDDGSWRRRRGADPALVERFEGEALAKRQDANPPIDAPEPDADQDTAAPDPAPTAMSDFEKVRIGIVNAANLDELDEWIDFSREVALSKSQNYELGMAMSATRQRLAAEAGQGELLDA